jgi:hypothetical protein
LPQPLQLRMCGIPSQIEVYLIELNLSPLYQIRWKRRGKDLALEGLWKTSLYAIESTV